jgi:tricorn protease
MRTRIATLSTLFVLLGALAAAPASAQTKLLRFPDIHGDKVVFTYAGDLWTAPASGGTAVRLTAHPGLELFAKFSPDGRWIAFSGQYDGDEQVYVVPSEGGVPRQLTFYPARGPLPPRWGYDNQVYGWTPDGSAVLFRSLRDTDSGRTETMLYTVRLEGGLPKPLPMPTAGAGDLSPDATRIVYSPLFRDFRHWKRYEGGWAQSLYIFDLKTADLRPVAHSRRTERDPMWIGEAIYFVSDRGGTLDLYRWDPASDTVRQLTRHAPWDVRWASSDKEGRIVYELNGELRIYDVRADRDTPVSIRVPTDGVAMRPARVPAEKQIESASLAPKGERAVFVARGDVFSVPVEKGPTRNLTNTSRAHDKWGRWSPDGSKIAFVSDLTGEDEIYLIDPMGSGKPEQLTSNGDVMRFAPEWSPDGKRLAFSDGRGRLWVLTVADRKLVEVVRETRGLLNDFAWSADGGWLAFSLQEESGLRALHVWGVEEGRVRRVTDGFFNERGPSWDPDGNYLYYVSDRAYAPQISQREWNYAVNRTGGVFALALRKDVPHPFPPQSDEVKIGEPDEDEDGGKAAEKKAAEKPKGYIKIDFDGLAARAARVPVEADNYTALFAVKDALLYVRAGAFNYGRESYTKPTLYAYSLKDREESQIADGVANVSLSPDGSKVLLRQGQAWSVYDAKPKAKDGKTISTKELMVDRVPAEEWAQIFDEVWRRYRDFFYVRNMHGYDWKAIADRYRPWLEWVGHRSDLNYLIAEMIAELNAGHTYIEGGDFELPDRPGVGLPGARFDLDEASGRYRVARILQGQNEEEGYRSPLTEVGVDVKEGEYVLAVDGVELVARDNPYRLLQHKKDPVTLLVNSKPTMDGARKVTYTPIRSEAALLYLNWVEGNRRKVSEMTGGRVGYLHIPDMGARGIAEFIKAYYPQIRKEGLVVDVRSNGGGNVSQMIIERLRRDLLAVRYGSLSDDPGTYPGTVFHGPMVCLLNETSASDGDIFPYMFRRAGLGPLIGKRSWGGVVGITSLGPLIDGGTVFVPLQGMVSTEGEWIIEGHGVDPDLVVENDPKSVIEGRDPQLERAVAEVLKAMEREPKRLAPRPPDPVKLPTALH